MSDAKQDPTKPIPNDEKFKPQNVQDESAGNVTSAGRQDRNIEHDVPRGSEPETEHRGQ